MLLFATFSVFVYLYATNRCGVRCIWFGRKIYVGFVPEGGNNAARSVRPVDRLRPQFGFFFGCGVLGWGAKEGSEEAEGGQIAQLRDLCAAHTSAHVSAIHRLSTVCLRFVILEVSHVRREPRKVLLRDA